MTRGLRDDDGAITLLMVVIALALLLSIGLVVDGGAKIRAVQTANRVAAEAARAGLQQIDVAGVQTGSATVVRTADAVRAAQAVLAAAGATGSAAVHGRTIEVTATVQTDAVFLGLAGIDTLTGSGSSTAELVIDE